ncbi:MAG: hypothetical protein WA941_08480 [Nitrososphaeraceae archaeon]
MSNNSISYNQYKKYSYYLPQRIGPGALPNNQLTMCKVCNKNGYPHEAVVIQDEKIVNYHDGSEHIHKQVLDDSEIWTALWSST